VTGEVPGHKEVRRIVVLGCAGSGKTIFARRVAERIGQPAICLDDLVEQLGAENSTPALQPDRGNSRRRRLGE